MTWETTIDGVRGVPHWATVGAVAVTSTRVLFVGSDRERSERGLHLVVLDTSTGALVHDQPFSTNVTVFNPELLVDGRLVVVHHRGTLYGFDAERFTRSWTVGNQ